MVAVKKFLKEYKPFIEFITIPLFTAILPILWPTKVTLQRPLFK